MLVVAVAAAVLGAFAYEHHRTGDVYHPHARFVPQPTPTLAAHGPERVDWPLYGYNPEHTRFFPAPPAVRPPFSELWVHNSHALLEFPPVIYGDHIFQLADDGVLERDQQARRATPSGSRQLGTLSASTPAVDRDDRVRDAADRAAMTANAAARSR